MYPEVLDSSIDAIVIKSLLRDMGIVLLRQRSRIQSGPDIERGVCSCFS